MQSKFVLGFLLQPLFFSRDKNFNNSWMVQVQTSVLLVLRPHRINSVRLISSEGCVGTAVKQGNSQKPQSGRRKRESPRWRMSEENMQSSRALLSRCRLVNKIPVFWLQGPLPAFYKRGREIESRKTNRFQKLSHRATCIHFFQLAYTVPWDLSQRCTDLSPNANMPS